MMLLLRLAAIFLRSVQCSRYSIRCLCACQLRRGLGLCLPCSLLQRAWQAFQELILLLRRLSILVGGSLLFRRFRRSNLIPILGLGILCLVGCGILSTWVLSLDCQPIGLGLDLGVFFPFLFFRPLR